MLEHTAGSRVVNSTAKQVYAGEDSSSGIFMLKNKALKNHYQNYELLLETDLKLQQLRILAKDS